MRTKTQLFLVSVLVGAHASAAHIVADTRSGDTLIKRTHTYANGAGDLRVDEQGFSASASMSAEAGAGSKVTTTYEPGRINDTTIFQVKGQAIVSLEGDKCHRMTADSEPPPVFGGADSGLADLNKQMADAMKQAGAAMQQAVEQTNTDGMSPDQKRALDEMRNMFSNSGAIKPKDTLHLEKLNETVRVGRYKGDGYLVADEDGTEKYRIWVASAGSVAGAREIRRAMKNMVDVYAQYLDQMGGAALMQTSLTTLFTEQELDGTYPIRIEDLQSGEITDIVEAHSQAADVEFYPECEVTSMFGQ